MVPELRNGALYADFKELRVLNSTHA